ncbi:MAG TPA: hypothetical protein VLK56_07840 [Solirubrobacterales bacterium]|nr:hypothetical protein [Solirubrobacterales bacterium]
MAPATLSDLAAVEAWLGALLNAGINFHPEESFGELVDLKTGARCFSVSDANRLDRLMDRAYELCDPYEVAVRLISENGNPAQRAGIETSEANIAANPDAELLSTRVLKQGDEFSGYPADALIVEFAYRDLTDDSGTPGREVTVFAANGDVLDSQDFG